MDAVEAVLERSGLKAGTVTVLKNLPLENASWLVDSGGDDGRYVLRRYHHRATPEDLAYEHAVVGHLARAGWVVPEPLGPLVRHQGHWYCPTRYVPGQAVRGVSTDQRLRRGRDLARLHVALRDLGAPLGQRPRWRAQHRSVTVHDDIDWDLCLGDFARADERLASWAHAAAAATRRALAALPAEDLPLMVVHGDFAEWNVHYDGDDLAGVVDFGLTHLDSRPYELAIARTYRSPATIDGYREELARHGWPLSELEEAAIVPIYQAFRVDMAAWALDLGRRTGVYDLLAIERQLALSGCPRS